MACSNLDTCTTLKLILTSQPFHQSNINYNLYINVSTSKSCTLLILYVDDIMFIGDDTIDIQKTKEALEKRYKMLNLGQIKLYVGLQFVHAPKHMYIANLIKKFCLQRCNHCTTPMEESTQLHFSMDS